MATNLETEMTSKPVHVGVLVFSALAAVFWGLSTIFSAKPLPDGTSKTWKNAHSSDYIEDLHKVMRRQGQWNAIAAACAAIAATLSIFDG